MLAFALSLAVFAAAPAPSPRPPVFEVHALGVLGGDTDTNLTSFLLGKPGEPATLMIDGGSVLPGIQRMLERSGKLAADASPTARAKAALEVLRPLQALLLTHSHLDHWGGFADKATLELALASQGRPSLKIIGLPAALDALREHLFHSPLWADFTAVPAKNPALALQPLAPGASATLGDFKIEDVLINHPVPSAAFLIRRGDAAYLHLGDTGATEAVWAAARPLLQAHQLRGIALELSFAASDEKLAAATGHLTRSSFLLELNKLAGAVKSPPPALGMTDEQALQLARALAPAFRDCPVMVIHIKALSYDRVVEELRPLQAAGLNLIIPEQGKSYSF